MRTWNMCRFLLRLCEKLYRFLPMLFWILLIFGFDSIAIGTLTILAAVIHEVGHIAAFGLITGGVTFKAALSGPKLYSSKILSYREQLLIASGGPIINIIIFLLSLTVRGLFGEYIFLFGIINLCTAISNLIPILGYDGYNILCSLLNFFLPHYTVAVILSTLSHSLLILLLFISLYLMAKFNAGYFIFFIFLSILIKNAKGNKNIILRENKRKQEYF